MKYGHENFSSFEEFKTQLALGTVSDKILDEIADDDEAPDIFKDHMIDVCGDINLLSLIGREYKAITDKQLKYIISKTASAPKLIDAIACLTDTSERKVLSVDVGIYILEHLKMLLQRFPKYNVGDEDAIEDIYYNVVYRKYTNGSRLYRELLTEHCNIEVASAAVGRACRVLWNRGELTLKESE